MASKILAVFIRSHVANASGSISSPFGLLQASSFSPLLLCACRPSSIRSSAQTLPLCPLRRGYQTRAWDLFSQLQVRQEIPVVSEMLPNRKLMQALFSPHGITFIPVLRGHPEDLPRPIMEDPLDKPAPMEAIGIKTWRRLKMKKHKINKRRKALRYKNK